MKGRHYDLGLGKCGCSLWLHRGPVSGGNEGRDQENRQSRGQAGELGVPSSGLWGTDFVLLGILERWLCLQGGDELKGLR